MKSCPWVKWWTARPRCPATPTLEWYWRMPRPANSGEVATSSAPATTAPRWWANPRPRTTRRGGAPFVGRDPELAQVLSAFERSRLDTTPILVSIAGPPGSARVAYDAKSWPRISAQAEAPHIVLQRSEAYAQGHALAPPRTCCAASSVCPKARPAAEAAKAIVSRLGLSTREELTRQNRDLLARLLANEPLPGGPRPARFARRAVARHDRSRAVSREQRANGDLDGRSAVGRSGKHRLARSLARSRDGPSFGRDGAGASRLLVGVKRTASPVVITCGSNCVPISKRASRAIAHAVVGESVPEDIVERIAGAGGRATAYLPKNWRA